MELLVKFLKWLVLTVFGFFLIRCFDLMVIRGKYFRRLAEENRIRKEFLFAPRGKILDRNGNELARSSVRYFDQEGKEISRESALERIAGGENLRKEWVREYPFGKAAAHISGYLNEAGFEEIKGNWDCPVWEKELVGRGGLEQEYDCFLRGKIGQRLVEVSADGKLTREIGKQEPEPGNDLKLNLDWRWQKAAFEALSGKTGAAVVMIPQTGEIRALVSSPSFDPNVFTIKRDEAAILNLLNDSSLPFLNRAIAGAYHPGSVFKIAVAAAGLEEGRINSQTEFEDTGVIKIGEWEFGNWYYLQYGKKEGMVDLIKAIKRSNDIYFYKTGEALGVEKLLSWAGLFGFGQKTGIDLPNEVAGLLPSPEWKKKTKGESWFLGNTYHLSIGQGDLTATPLQIAVETAVVANGGKRCQPRLAECQSSSSKCPSCQDLGIKRENLELIKRGMVEACSTGGTGFPFFNFEPKVACKTGTAEVGDGTDDTHAWFTLFYPVDDPKYVITVMLERGGQGSYDAAPIAKKVIEKIKEEGG